MSEIEQNWEILTSWLKKYSPGLAARELVRVGGRTHIRISLFPRPQNPYLEPSVKAAAISDSLNSLNPAFCYMLVIDVLMSEALERGMGSTVDRV